MCMDKHFVLLLQCSDCRDVAGNFPWHQALDCQGYRLGWEVCIEQRPAKLAGANLMR